MTNTNKPPKTESHTLLSSVIGCSFVALAYRFGRAYYEQCDSKDEAIEFLKNGSEAGMHMDVAVIDCSTNEMVWHKDYLGKNECQERADRFIAEIMNQKKVQTKKKAMEFWIITAGSLFGKP
jgi:hypothetical protein